MRTGKRGLFALVVSLCLAVMLACPAAEAGQAPWQTRDYHFAGWLSSAGQYLWAAVTWTIIARDTGLKVTILESAGTEAMMHLVQGKKADMGQFDVTLVRKAFGDKHDLRSMFMFAPGVWQFAVAKDANIKTLKDLHGKKWNPGPAGGGSTHITVQFMDMFGIKPVYQHATLTDAAEAYSDRQIVGFTYRGSGGDPTSVMVEANAGRPMNFLSLTDEEIARIREKWPHLSKFQVRAKLYVGQNEPFTTIADVGGQTVGVHKDVPAEAVYEFTKSYWKNFQTICKQYPSICASSPQASVSESLLPLHPGAVKYYQETGLSIPERAVAPEAKK